MKVALVIWLASAWVSTNAGPLSDFEAMKIVTESLPTGSIVTSIQPATPSSHFLSSISDTTQPINLDEVLREITGSGAEVVSANTVEPASPNFGHITSAVPFITTLNVNRQGNLISAEDDHFSSGEFDFDGDDGFRIINSGNGFLSQGVTAGVGGSVPLSAFISGGDASGLGGVGGSVGGGAFGHGGSPATVGTPLPNFGGAGGGFGGSDFGAGGGFGGSDFGAGGGFGGSDFGAGGGFGGGDVSFGEASGSVGVPLTGVPLTAVPSTAGPHGGGGVILAGVGGGLGGAGVTHGGVGGDFGGAGVPLDLSGHGGGGLNLGGGFDGAGGQFGSVNTGLGGGSVSFGSVDGGFGGAGLSFGKDSGAGLSFGSDNGAGLSFGSDSGVGLPLGSIGGGHGGALTTSGPAIVSGGPGLTLGGADIIQADFHQVGDVGQVLGGFSGVSDGSSIGFGLSGPQTLVTHEPVVTSIAAPTSGYLPPSTTFLSSPALPAADYLPPTTIISSPAAPAVNDVFSQGTFISHPTETIFSSPTPTVGPTKSVKPAPLTTKFSSVTPGGITNLLPTQSIATPTNTVISAPKAPLLPQLPIKTLSTNGLGTLLGSLSTKSITPGQTLGSILRGLDGQDGIVVVDINSKDIAGTRVSTDDDNDDLDNFRLDIDSLEDDTPSLSLGGGTVTTDAGVSIDTVGISLGDADTKSVSSIDTTTTAVDTGIFGSAKKALGPKFLFQTPLVDILSTKGRWLGTLIGGLVDLGDAVAKNFNKEKLF